ncbi:hypothetical protein SLS64_005621 [Diaporthe eres]
MGKKSVSSRVKGPPPMILQIPPMPPPTSTQGHIGGKSSDMGSTKANETLVITNAKQSDSQVSYGEKIIRKDMETWTAFSKPKHFAQRRADFANSTPWFRGLQVGYWSTNSGDPRNGKDANGHEQKYCTGLYIAGCPPVGRYLDSEVIITSINGPDNTDRHIADRRREAEHNLVERVPVGVAVSRDAWKPDADGVRTFPCPIPEGLDCVALAWFLVTHMWPKPALNEKGITKDVWMVRLEKIDLSERSWWSNAAHGALPYPSLEERDFKAKAAEEACGTCGQISFRLFKSHFVCLNGDCEKWFRVNGELIENQPDNMVYNDDFLRERFDRLDDNLVIQPLEETYPNLYPTFEQFVAKNYPDSQGPESSVTAASLAARNEALLTGFSCPRCGLANSRVQYHGWYCRNTDCRDAEGNVNPFRYHAPPHMVTPALLEAERQQAKTKVDKLLSALLGYQGETDLDSHVAHNLDFGGGCRATIFRPKPGSAAVAKADKLFKQIQEDAASGALGLARRSVSANGGMNLTNHFVENYGERYNLPFALSDIPLNEAPGVVRDALATANGYMREYFGDDNDECEFNEIYIAAYLSKKMGMSFHDDGETGLGSIIGTWTIGGRATFKFCIKPQFDYGRSKKDGVWMKPQGGQVDPVPAGCTEEAFRAELRATFERGEISAEEWTAQLQQHMDAHMAGPQNKRTYAKRTLLSFTVEHGDVVIMWGPNTQRYMEHAVDCRSPMRFAVTLRRVTKDMGTPEQWARLDARLESDKAFTPSWAEAAKKRKAVDGGEGESEGQPAGRKKARAKKAKAK